VHDIFVPCAATAFSKIEVVGVPERNIETTHKALADFAVRRHVLVGGFDGFFLGFWGGVQREDIPCCGSLCHEECTAMSRNLNNNRKKLKEGSIS
jgi:hypothetical protein